MSWPVRCSPAVVSSSNTTTRSQSTCCLIFCCTCCWAAHLQSSRRWGRIHTLTHAQEDEKGVAIMTHLLPGNGGDAGRSNWGRRAGRGACPGDGLQPVTAQYSDCVQHVVSPHAVEPPHPLRQNQAQWYEMPSPNTLIPSLWVFLQCWISFSVKEY